MTRALLTLLAAAAVTGCGGSERRASQADVRDDPGLRVFTGQGCGSCHRLSAAGSSSSIGPNLDNALNNRDRDSITQAIVNPPADSVMPADYGRRLSAEQLDQLVYFLVRAAGD